MLLYLLLEEVQTDKATNGRPLATGVETQQLIGIFVIIKTKLSVI